MTQTIKISNGDTLNFPDEMSDDEIQTAIHKEYGTPKNIQPTTNDQSSYKDAFRYALGLPAKGKSSLAQDIISGAGKGITGMAAMLPNVTQGLSPTQQALMKHYNSSDVDKLMGTTDAPFLSKEGVAQTVGSLLAPGNVAMKGLPLLEKVGAEGAAKLSNETLPLQDMFKNIGKKAVDYFEKPGLANKVSQDLSKGAKTSEDVSKSIAEDIQDKYAQRHAESSIYFNHVLDNVGKDEIFPHVDPLITTAMDQGKSLLNKVQDLNVGNLYQRFKQSPTFENAHKLQSELGTMIGDLTERKGKQGLTQDELNTLGNVRNARETLKTHMQDFLEQHDLNSNDNLTSSWLKGVDLYKDNVAPYTTTNKLRKIIFKGETNVQNIHDIFKYPSDIRNALTGETQIGYKNKILQDLSQDTKDKILSSKIGVLQNSNDMEGLSQALKNAQNKGYQSLLKPELKNDINAMDAQVKRRKIGKTIAQFSGVPTTAASVALALKPKSYGYNEDQDY